MSAWPGGEPAWNVGGAGRFGDCASLCPTALCRLLVLRGERGAGAAGAPFPGKPSVGAFLHGCCSARRGLGPHLGFPDGFLRQILGKPLWSHTDGATASFLFALSFLGQGGCGLWKGSSPWGTSVLNTHDGVLFTPPQSES